MALDRREDGREYLVDAMLSMRGLSVLVTQPDQQKEFERLAPFFAARASFSLYAGNLTANAGLFAESPVNTEDRPRIAFSAPRMAHGGADLLQGGRLTDLFESLLNETPPEHDPYLALLTKRQRGYVRAGLSYYRSLADGMDAQLTGAPETAASAQHWFEDYVKRFELRSASDNIYE